MWGCEDVDLQMWGCEDLDLQMWGCEDQDLQMWGCEDLDLQVWGCEDPDLQVWGCEDVDLQIWGCEDVDQHMWGCEDVDLQMWGREDVKVWRSRSAGVRAWRRSADVKVWRCRSADVKVWRCSITAAFLRRTLRRRSREKCLAEKTVSAAGKTSKKCRFAPGKIQSRRKNTLQQLKNTLAAEKMHSGDSGKNPPRQEKICPRQEKTGRGKKNCRTEQIHFRNVKKEQPFCAQTRTKRSANADLTLYSVMLSCVAMFFGLCFAHWHVTSRFFPLCRRVFPWWIVHSLDSMSTRNSCPCKKISWRSWWSPL